MGFRRAEIEAAFRHYQEVAAVAAAHQDWSAWVECFTPDVHYIEHHYGEIHGREAVLDWIQSTMNVWPVKLMNSFPWDWWVIEEDRGWVIGQVENRMADPGDGKLYQEYNWSRLVYAGNGLFSSEEDVYNPARFGDMLKNWMKAWREHHPDQPDGPRD
jgi:hypothetical protein